VLREVVEVGLAEALRAARVAPDLAQQPAEALAGEGGLGDLAPPERRPQVVVDPLIGRGRRSGAGKAEAGQGFPERGALGPVEIEERVIEVEEDGAGAVQAGTTWRGR
jgi:hypothetical protein